MADRPSATTAAVIWGEPGNNAQHSFFQLLHQGTPRAALGFPAAGALLLRQPAAAESRHRQLPGAGARPSWTASPRRHGPRASCERQGLPAAQLQALVPHKVDPGSRPSTHRAVPAARPGDTRTPDRALRAQRAHAERGLGHQRLRSVGRGARQEAHRAARARRCRIRPGGTRRPPPVLPSCSPRPSPSGAPEARSEVVGEGRAPRRRCRRSCPGACSADRSAAGDRAPRCRSSARRVPTSRCGRRSRHCSPMP